MPEEETQQARSVPDALLASSVEKKGDVSDLGNALGQDALTSLQEKPDGNALQKLDQLEEKIEALIAHCETLNLLNKTLGEQLNKERTSRVRVEEVNSAARQKVDQLVKRLRDIEATEK